MFNVEYDRGNGTVSHYLTKPVCLTSALLWRDKFDARYLGKPYPNGKGTYPFSKGRVVPI